MKERPILFSGAMVKAILDGRKSQTRRVVKPQPEHRALDEYYWKCAKLDAGYCHTNRAAMGRLMVKCCPYGEPGRHLWVRETWARDGRSRPIYRASESDALTPASGWKPSIHMPRELSRIPLEIVSVRVERLQEIGQGDACAEGAPAPFEPIGWYRQLWDSLNAASGFGWEANPWVWVAEFRRTRDD